MYRSLHLRGLLGVFLWQAQDHSTEDQVRVFQWVCPRSFGHYQRTQRPSAAPVPLLVLASGDVFTGFTDAWWRTPRARNPQELCLDSSLNFELVPGTRADLARAVAWPEDPAEALPWLRAGLPPIDVFHRQRTSTRDLKVTPLAKAMYFLDGVACLDVAPVLAYPKGRDGRSVAPLPGLANALAAWLEELVSPFGASHVHQVTAMLAHRMPSSDESEEAISRLRAAWWALGQSPGSEVDSCLAAILAAVFALEASLVMRNTQLCNQELHRTALAAAIARAAATDASVAEEYAYVSTRLREAMLTVLRPASSAR